MCIDLVCEKSKAFCVVGTCRLTIGELTHKAHIDKTLSLKYDWLVSHQGFYTSPKKSKNLKNAIHALLNRGKKIKPYTTHVVALEYKKVKPSFVRKERITMENKF